MPLDRTVVDPAEVGVDPARIADLVERGQRDLDDPSSGLGHLQVAVARHGRLICDVTLGDGAADGARLNLFSISKAFVAAMAWKLIGDGRLAATDRVVEHFEEFGANGKDVVTVEQLLTHTAGFPSAPLGPPDWFDRDARIAKMASWRLNWEPGSKMEYHPSSAHWVLAEIIERVAGRDYRDFWTEAIAEPLGLGDIRLGATEAHPDDWADVPPIRFVGEAPPPEALEAAMGHAIDLGEVTDRTVVRYSEPEVRNLGVPGGGGIARAGDVALFYQALLDDRDRLWDPAVLADGTGNIRVTMTDPLFGVAANRTLGLVVSGEDGHGQRRGFGKTVSGRAFGHMGAGAQSAWADPATGISFCCVTNDHRIDLLAQGVLLHGLSTRAGALCVET